MLDLLLFRLLSKPPQDTKNLQEYVRISLIIEVWYFVILRLLFLLLSQWSQIRFLSWLIKTMKGHSEIWFLQTPGLFRCQGPPKNWKRSKNFLKAKTKAKTWNFQNLVIFSAYLVHLEYFYWGIISFDFLRP